MGAVGGILIKTKNYITILFQLVVGIENCLILLQNIAKCEQLSYLFSPIPRKLYQTVPETRIQLYYFNGLSKILQKLFLFLRTFFERSNLKLTIKNTKNFNTF